LIAQQDHNMPRLQTTPACFDEQMYAQLPSVQEAHQAIKQRWDRFESFARDASQALAGSGIEHDIGVCLLHRHFAVAPGELMLEDLQHVNASRALVTSARPRPQGQPIAPSRWGLVAGESPALVPSSVPSFVPLEFSSDPAVARIGRRLANRPGAIDSLGTLLQQHGLDDILGIAVLRRDGLTAGRQEIHVEDTQGDASVVTVQRQGEMDFTSLVETSWMLMSGNASANAACFIYCYTWCISREGHHEEPHTREHDKVREHVPGERKTPAPDAG
jgi:hypothetical protein